MQAYINWLFVISKLADGKGMGMDFQGVGGMIPQQYKPNLVPQSMHIGGKGDKGEGKGEGEMKVLDELSQVGVVAMSGGGVGESPPTHTEDQHCNQSFTGMHSGERSGYQDPQGRQDY